MSCIFASVFSFSACTSTFDDLNTNPDATTQVKSSMLATYVIKDMVTTIWEYNEFLSRRLFWGEQICRDKPLFGILNTSAESYMFH